jgi:hypothetical protein
MQTDKFTKQLARLVFQTRKTQIHTVSRLWKQKASTSGKQVLIHGQVQKYLNSSQLQRVQSTRSTGEV